MFCIQVDGGKRKKKFKKKKKRKKRNIKQLCGGAAT